MAKSLLALCLTWLSMACFSCNSVWAEHDLVFSAQHYRWSGHYIWDTDGTLPQQTLDDVDNFHLYRVNADGSKCQRLTFGHQDDMRPLWSPDGKHVLFARHRVDGKIAVCIVGAAGGKVTSILVFPNSAYSQELRYAWSPDGRSIGVTATSNAVPPPQSSLYLIDVKANQTRKILGVSDFAWSPDNRYLYLSSPIGDDKIINTKTGASCPVTRRVWNPTWLDNQHLIGNVCRGKVSSFNEDDTFQVLSPQGQPRWQVNLGMIKHAQKNDEPKIEFYPSSVNWYSLTQNSPWILVEQKWTMSDGTHHAIFKLHQQTGQYRFLKEAQFLGLSPNRRFMAIARHDWVGPYKRGGRRAGPLEIVSLRTGKAHAITSQLMYINGGDWRSPTNRGKSN